ncbi:MAG: coenzyme F420-0:L-glutamate ligase [Candidatus Bipolaricaulis sp.]|nr:coenzyme F420-0:L-glutamate ligase [Candidatus Bipolaricaulis sp.]
MEAPRKVASDVLAVQLLPLRTDEIVDPAVAAGRTAGTYYADLLRRNGLAPRDGDILVVSSKVTAFHEGCAVRLADVRASWKARVLGRLFRKDPRKLQLIMETGRVAVAIPMCWIFRIPAIRRAMQETSANPEAMRRAFARNNAFVLMVNAHGTYFDDAGIDYSNAPDGVVTILPKDPCATASRIRTQLAQEFGVDAAVIITDTAAKLGRIGSNDVAIGYAGMDPVTRLTFSDDLFGVPRSGGVDVIVDSVAATAGLVMGQTTEMTPGVLVRGVAYEPERAAGGPAGMEAVAYPRRTVWKATVLTVLVTAWFFLANALTLQRWPRRTRA